MDLRTRGIVVVILVVVSSVFVVIDAIDNGFTAWNRGRARVLGDRLALHAELDPPPPAAGSLTAVVRSSSPRKRPRSERSAYETVQPVDSQEAGAQTPEVVPGAPAAAAAELRCSTTVSCGA